MSEKTIFELLHSFEQVNHKMIVRWKRKSAHDLGISHIVVLHELRQDGEVRPSDLAKRLGFTPASLTHLSTKLSNQDLIIRRQDDTDRRTTYWSISEKGIALLEQAQKDGQGTRRELFAHLSEEEQETLLAIYQKLDQSLD
ncbi:MarR family transcriptional regulator [Sporosarcina sp. FSL K6-1522]|uniref:MarR family winged helix-turn-helix transcriptional regulator n=1 Tax=Sporosarcina sp. FSL K6-1522 TaxID=2921554 RepID=UPI00315A7089